MRSTDRKGFALGLILALFAPLQAEDFETPLYDALLSSIQSLLPDEQLTDAQKQTVLMGEQALQVARLTDTLRLMAKGGKCSQVAPVILSEGTVQVVAPAEGETVRICRVVLSWAAPVDLQYVAGTGATCGTGSSNVSGVMKQMTYIVDTAEGSPIELPESDGFCLSQTGTASGGGYVVYERIEN